MMTRLYHILGDVKSNSTTSRCNNWWPLGLWRSCSLLLSACTKVQNWRELHEVKDEHCNCTNHTSIHTRITHPHEPNEPTSPAGSWSRSQSMRRTTNISQNWTKRFMQKKANWKPELNRNNFISVQKNWGNVISDVTFSLNFDVIVYVVRLSAIIAVLFKCRISYCSRDTGTSGAFDLLRSYVRSKFQENQGRSLFGPMAKQAPIQVFVGTCGGLRDSVKKRSLLPLQYWQGSFSRRKPRAKSIWAWVAKKATTKCLQNPKLILQAEQHGKAVQHWPAADPSRCLAAM